MLIVVHGCCCIDLVGRAINGEVNVIKVIKKYESQCTGLKFPSVSLRAVFMGCLAPSGSAKKTIMRMIAALFSDSGADATSTTAGS